MLYPSSSLYPSDNLYPSDSDVGSGSGEYQDIVDAGIFPEDVFLSVPFAVMDKYFSVSAKTMDGNEYVTQVSGFPKRVVSLRSNAIKDGEARKIFNFYAKQKNVNRFKFVIPYKADYFDEFVGVSDGAKTEYDMPCKDASNVVVYVDGSETTAYTYYPGGGSYGVDKIVFDNAPSKGSVITCDFSGKLCISAMFKIGGLSIEQFFYMLYNLGIEIVEV